MEFATIEACNLSFTYTIAFKYVFYFFAGAVTFKHRFWTTETVTNIQSLQYMFIGLLT